MNIDILKDRKNVDWLTGQTERERQMRNLLGSLLGVVMDQVTFSAAKLLFNHQYRVRIELWLQLRDQIGDRRV